MQFICDEPGCSHPAVILYCPEHRHKAVVNGAAHAEKIVISEPAPLKIPLKDWPLCKKCGSLLNAGFGFRHDCPVGGYDA